MNVLMFGWEFPPYSYGGLGVACEILTKGLVKNKVKVKFVVPYSGKKKPQHLELISTNKENIEINFVDSLIHEYINENDYEGKLRKLNEEIRSLYGINLYKEVYRYSQAAKEIALNSDYDILHCHDWMTYLAGINAKKISKKPLIIHIHNTVFDRSKENPSVHEYNIEKAGFENADHIIAISNRIKETLIHNYGIPDSKISVVHWGIDHENEFYNQKNPKKFQNKIVLFAGRVTSQKGPDYFIEAAKKVLDKYKNVRFVVVGNGDMLPKVINRSIELGISNKINFTGWLNQKDVFKAFKIADLFVMPSVSEPFGLVALESIKNGTTVIVSKQSGVSEVLNNCLKVDFWDTNELANKIINVLTRENLYNELKSKSEEEIKNFNTDKTAKKTIDIYRQILKL